MARQGRKWLALAGLCGALGVAGGCTERQEGAAKRDARQVGQEVGEAAKEVEAGAREAARKAEGAAREAGEGFREGVGGSGAEKRDGAPIGDRPGVINDGEGPLEENERR
jgi:type IV secretory pathway TrbL component